MKVLVPFLTTLVVASTIAHAQTPSRSMPTPTNASAPPASAATVLADAVVQGVDAERGVMTLKHGAIANIAMPPMTMRYAVADRKMLGTVKAGDKVRFRVEMRNGQAVITHIEAAR